MLGNSYFMDEDYWKAACRRLKSFIYLSRFVPIHFKERIVVVRVSHKVRDKYIPLMRKMKRF